MAAPSKLWSTGTLEDGLDCLQKHKPAELLAAGDMATAAERNEEIKAASTFQCWGCMAYCVVSTQCATAIIMLLMPDQQSSCIRTWRFNWRRSDS